jgi:hypothetical protein
LAARDRLGTLLNESPPPPSVSLLSPEIKLKLIISAELEIESHGMGKFFFNAACFHFSNTQHQNSKKKN